MIVYLSGPISGRSFQDVRARFNAAEADIAYRLDDPGTRIVNPADIACWGLSWTAYMDIAKRILRSGEIALIYMLEGWEDSRGATIEHEIAKKEDIVIMYQSEEDQKLKERKTRPYDAMGDDQGRGYTADEAYRREFIERYDDAKD